MFWASLVAQRVKCLPAMRETCVRSLEKEMATHSWILAWRIPWTEEPVGTHTCAETSAEVWSQIL